jgi:MFS family permease
MSKGEEGPVPGRSPAGPNDPYAAWRHAPFRLYVGGQFLAMVAGAMQTVAISWELWERTKNPLVLAWVGLIQAFPVIGLALWAGQLADRLDRRLIIMVVLCVQALVALALAALSFLHGPLHLIFFCLFVAGANRAFLAPTGAAMLPQLVPAHTFANAVAWRSSLFHTAMVLGPSLGGLGIWAFSGAGPLYLFHAASIAIFLFFLWRMGQEGSLRPLPSSPRRKAETGELWAGLVFVFRSKIILAAMTLDLFAVLFGGATGLLPIFAKEILKVEALGFGFLRAAPGLGAILMGLILAHRPPMRHAGRALLSAVAGFGLATIVFGLSESFLLSLSMLFLCGVFDQVSVVVRHTLVQTRTPDEMRGRVSAVNTVFISSSNELGEFESGLVARFFNPVVSVVSGGIGTLLVVLAVMGLWPPLRKLDRMVPEADPNEPPAPCPAVGERP